MSSSLFLLYGVIKLTALPSAEITVSLSIFTVPLYTLIAESFPVICAFVIFSAPPVMLITESVPVIRALAISSAPPVTATAVPDGLKSRPSPFSLVSVTYKVPAVTSILPDNSYPFKFKVISEEASNNSEASTFWHKVRVPPVTDAASQASLKFL